MMVTALGFAKPVSEVRSVTMLVFRDSMEVVATLDVTFV